MVLSCPQAASLSGHQWANRLQRRFTEPKLPTGIVGSGSQLALAATPGCHWQLHRRPLPVPVRTARV